MTDADLPSVRLWHDAAYGYADPDGYLGSDVYKLFSRAVGGTYDRRVRAQRFHVDSVHDVVRRLRDGGFHAEIHPDLRRAHLEITAARWYDLQAARERVAIIGEEIRAASGQVLFAHQGPGAEWLAMRRRALLADEPGVAKTRQVLLAIPAGAPAIVVCPAGVKGAWLGEIERCRPQLRAFVLGGRDSLRWPGPSEILVTNYESLRSPHDPPCDGKLPPRACTGCAPPRQFWNQRLGCLVERPAHLEDCTGFEKDEDRALCPGCAAWLREALPGTVLALDELHMCKNPDSDRTRTSKAMARGVLASPGGRAWGITGTPIKSKAIDLWHVLDVIDLARETFGSFEAFAELFKAHRVDKRLVWGVPGDEVGRVLQRTVLRRTKADVFPDMPEKLFQDHVVSLGRREIGACDAIVAELGGVEEFEKLIGARALPFALVSKIAKAVAAAKIPALLALVADLESTDRASDGRYADPLVVFSEHRGPIDALASRKGWAVITGDTSTQGPERKRIIDAFQRGEYLGLAATSGTAGTGITLTRSHRMIVVDCPWNPSDLEQLTDRIHRAGQFERCLYWILKADHALDRRIAEVAEAKTVVIDASVGASAISHGDGGGIDAEAEIRRLQEELSEGCAVRRMADSEERRATLEMLHTVEFRTRRQEKLASELASEAARIGISDRQWELARTLVAEARTGSEPPPSGLVRTNGLDTASPIDYVDAESGPVPEAAIGRDDDMQEDHDEPAAADTGDGDVEVELTEAVRGFGEAFDVLRGEDRVEGLIECVDRLTDDEREALFERLDGIFGDDEDDEDEDGNKDGSCPSCGGTGLADRERGILCEVCTPDEQETG